MTAGRTERQQAPATDPGTAAGFARFLDALSRFPDRPAVITDDAVVSRRAIDTASAAVARRALATGARPGTCVLLLLPLDAAGIVGYVGGLRTGATLVPLDPGVPDAYIEAIAARTGARAALVTEATAPRATALGLTAVVAGAAVGDSVAAGDPAPPAAPGVRPPSGADAARITFTSGSTGRPKGVVVAFDDEYWGDDPGVQGPIALLTPLGASVARFSIADAVVQARPLCPYDVRVSGLDGLEPFLRRHRAAELLIPIGLFRRLVAALGDRRLPDVADVRLSGEAIGLDDLRSFQAHFRPDATADCRYGLSETGRIAHRTVRAGDALPDVLTYPGRAPGLELALEDGDGQPVPAGEWGEIVVRGGAVRAGYLDDPDQQAARFFRTADGRRGYRTGDLGRILPDGSLEVLGRVDDQVSVRGTNVHLAAVEQAIRAVAGVADSAVVAREDGRGGVSLAALVMPDGPGTTGALTVAAIRRHLRATLPPAAVPSVFRAVPVLPRLEGGKLDRGAARALVDTADALASSPPGRRPATADGRAIAAIVAAVLGLDPDDLGADDDFFDLGGDSLAAEELVARLTRAYGGRLTRGDVLTAPTVAALARRVHADARTGGIVCLHPGGDGVPVFLAPGAGAEPFDLVRLAHHLGRRHPVYSYRSPFHDRRGLAPYGVGATARHYLRLLRAELGDTPLVLAGYSAGAVVAFDMAHRVAAAGGRVPLFACLDGTAPGARRVRADLAPPPAPSLRAELRSSPARRAPLVVAKVATRPLRAAVRRRLFTLTRRPDEQQRERFVDAAIAQQRHYRGRPYGGAALVLHAAEPSGGNVLGWERWLTGPLAVDEVPGDHHTMLEEPNVGVLADRLLAAISPQPASRSNRL